MSDDEIRQLVREANSEVPMPEFDVEEGLHDVLVRSRADIDWTQLTGRERNSACLVAARRGDRAAFTALVSDLTPLVWHVARSNGLSRAEGEDVTQTVWLALLRHIDRLADPRALAAWLITTARREAIHVRRQADRTRGVELGDAGAERLPAPGPSPEDEVLRSDRNRTLWTMFSQLSPRCQEMLRLTVLAGRAEYRAVAEALHMPVGGIGPTRGRCLKKLRELYEQESAR
jgi:RNA polymerase sigma factor (sigma-70 family)